MDKIETTCFILFKSTYQTVFFLFSKKIIACRIIASVEKTTITNVLFRRGLNYRKTVETDNTDFCC